MKYIQITITLNNSPVEKFIRDLEYFKQEHLEYLIDQACIEFRRKYREHFWSDD